jgi:diguanylate cyclase (GGDEF)-like protein
LIMVANRLRVVVTAELGEAAVQRPLLARLAGDEFTIFFPEIEDAADAERVARRIALAISEPFEMHGHSIDIGASVGVAISPVHGTGIESLMRAADIAMYHAKNAGGGRYCLFSEQLAEEHQRKIDTEAALSEAVQRGEFLLALSHS